ncbi:hypothetical protein LY78DRAFT_617795 [Colletotrichum sublineola]|nr:hypothetical protein LY78DRAFT_617795 [Colletotrichum sublineola]
MANCGFIAATDPPALASTTTTPPALSTLPLLLAPVASGTETSPPPSPASPTSTSFPPAATTTQDPSPTSITPVTVFETPTFSTLPSLILPNDFSSAPHVLDQDGNQMSGAVKGPGTALCRWMGPWGLVFAVVVGWLLS